MIIIEGMDGTGKTHLVSRLKTHFNIPVAPKSMSGDVEPLVDMKDWIQQTLHKGFQKVLFDRFALVSGPLYAPIMNDTYQLGIYQDLGWMSNKYFLMNHKVQPIIVYCIPPLEVVKSNLQGDLSNKVVEVYANQLYVAYVNRAAQETSAGTAMVFDYTNRLDFEKIIDFIGLQLTVRGKR